MRFDSYLFHPSAFHKLVTEPKTKADKEAGNLSVTTISELRKIYREERYQRKCGFESKYTLKGIAQEDNAITLYCRLKKRVYVKNTIRVENEFITGEPDLIDSENILNCNHGVDIKCSWSLFTFPFPDDDLDTNYWWQNQCYMYLTGAVKWSTAYCLMNAPADIIINEKKSVWYKMGMPEIGFDNYDAYLEKCQNIERNMIFNKAEMLADEPGFDFDTPIWTFDIPLNERMVEFTIDRDDNAIQKIEETVIRCRKYLNDLNSSLSKKQIVCQ